MTAVANIFDVNGDGFIDYYEFVSALHPSRDPYRRTVDIDQINEEVLFFVISTTKIAMYPQRFHSIRYLCTLLTMYFIDILIKPLQFLGEQTGVPVQLPKEVSGGAG